MAGEPWSPRRRRSFEALAGLYALLGGAVALALLGAGLSFAALAIGLAVTFALAVLTAVRSKAPGATAVMMAYSFAFAMLSWPILWLLALALGGEGE